MLTPEDATSALAALLGLAPGAIPDPQVARVAMIKIAREQGMTWRQIGSAYGIDSPQAMKAAAKRLAKHANAALLETAAQQLREAA